MRIAAGPAGSGASRIAVLDRDGRMPGRGAYICRGEKPHEPARACLALALRRRAIPRALRAAVTVDPKLVESMGR
jgi:predicted RNA-binding protein YlxR (DUF448 family)